MIRFGYGGSGTASFESITIENNGVIILHNGVSFGGGCQICVEKEAFFIVGKDTHFMGECHIVARKKIEIGNDSAISWNTQIIDTDIHKIYLDSSYINKDSFVIIGNHVWVCSGAKICKGVRVEDNTVIASEALITKSIGIGNCIVTGMPLKTIKLNINWEL